MLRLRLFLGREWLSLILGLIGVGLALSCLYSSRGLKDLMVLRRSRSQLETTLGNLRAENLALRADVQKLRDDEHYLQTLIRQELGYARDGELIYRFAADSSPPDR
jgi:cell division protein FtsB